MKKEDYSKRIADIAKNNEDKHHAKEQEKASVIEAIIKARASLSEAIASGDEKKHIEAEHKLSFLEDKKRALESECFEVDDSESKALLDEIRADYENQVNAIVTVLSKDALSFLKHVSELEEKDSEYGELVFSLMNTLTEQSTQEIRTNGMKQLICDFRQFKSFVDKTFVNLSDHGTKDNVLGWIELLKFYR